MRVLEVRWNADREMSAECDARAHARSQHRRRRDPRAWHEAAAPAWERATMRATRAWSLEAGVALVGTRLARDPDRGDGRGQLKAATRMLRAAQPRKTSPTGMSEKRPSPNLRDPHAHVLPGLYINRVPRGSSTRERMHSGMMDSVRARRARAAGACLALTTLTSRVSATQLRNAACRDDEQQQSDGVQGAAEATVRKYEADVRALPSRTSPLVGLDLPCPPVTAVSPVKAAHHTALRAGTIQDDSS